MIKRIKDKWGIENNFQFAVILVVFAVTGSVSAKLSGPTAEYFEIDSLHAILYWPIRLLIVFPIYQILLIVVAVFFFQFKFFWEFEKKILKRIGFGFLFKKKN